MTVNSQKKLHIANGQKQPYLTKIGLTIRGFPSRHHMSSEFALDKVADQWQILYNSATHFDTKKSIRSFADHCQPEISF